ncbi:8-amino-7-oxononanoate synthase [Halothece sp. PCC 7418]|uniref:8-amino-7-oxononanoate synthase n=1 Tax=Halothece sp. (strain PCC 7418) TaxID=65093 RepID=UPI0002A086A3|nr:8-amino-7-oxononanoate synthase [Halothece sp. PCC 7418]AFZ42630.1 8-amino-7-oxononanoate synthase [Halothece sp. PCC 7418]
MIENPAYDWIEKSLSTIEKAGWYRTVKRIESIPGAMIKLDGKSLLNFASNDYLGLASDQRLIQAATRAVQRYGTGSTGSRLLSGHRPLHDELESAIAQLKQTEDALVFSSGYLANLGTITALVGLRDLILADQYNHSSLKKGAVLTGGKVMDYKHCDLEDLEQQLSTNRAAYRRCLIVTDTLFSMDGDICPLPDLLDLAAKYQAMVLVDEAHATGVMGDKGGGCVNYFDCSDRAPIQMGTLSKALGSLGGYIAGSKRLIEFLRNRAPSWIYTTGLSPADTAAALAAIKIVREEPQRRQKLWENIQFLQEALADLPLLPSQSPILCIRLDNPTEAVKLSDHLQHKGIFAPAIRPPTVPFSRIRISLMATHEPEQLQYLVDELKAVL